MTARREATGTRGFETGDRAAVRSPVLTVEHYPTGLGEATVAESVARLWAEPELRDAVAVASPVLAAQAHDFTTGAAGLAPKRQQALLRGLLKYAIRICTRPTPFGLFSGTAVVGLGPAALVTGDPGQHLISGRVGFSYVKGLKEAAELEGDDVHLQLNPTARLRGERLEIAVNPRAEQDTNHEVVSVRVSPPVELLVGWLLVPVPRGEVVVRLAGEFPEADEPTLRGFLGELVRRGLVLTDRAPSAFDADPLRDRLADAPGAGPVLDRVGELSRSGVGRAADALARTYAELGSERNARQEHLQVDLHLDVRGEVPDEVGRRVTAALGALLRTTFAPAHDPLLEQHARTFVERYGVAEVPVLEALDARSGIGPPPGYPGARPGTVPAAVPPEPAHLARARLRGVLVERARRRGSATVEITDADLSGLDPAGRRAASYDVFVSLDGRDERPRVTLTPIGCAFPAGTAVGRFAHADLASAAHLRRMAAHEVAAHPELWFHELDYLNNRPAVNNVTLAPSCYPSRVRVTAVGGPEVDAVDVRELRVGVQEGHFYLRRGDDPRRVVCRRPNLVTPESSADVVRFLEEVGADGWAKPSWSWGELTDLLDHLPEVTYGGVVLAPEQWRLPTLEGDPAAQDEQLVAWVADAGVGRHVWAGLLDNRLLLDLDDRAHRDLLRVEAGAGLLTVAAAPAPGSLGWVQDRLGRRLATEVVVAVLSTSADAFPPLPPTSSLQDVTDQERVCLPGESWYYLRVHGPVATQNEVLHEVSCHDAVRAGAWFFVRYADPEHQLRVRFRAVDHDLAEVLALFRSFVDRGLADSFSLEPYRREVERYGGLPATLASEDLFSAESVVVAAQVEGDPPSTYESGTPENVEALDTGARLLEGYVEAMGLPEAERLALLAFADRGYSAEFEDEAPALRNEVRPLTAPDVDRGAIVIDGLAVWLQRLAREHAAADVGDEALLGVRQSLLHMYANRLGYSRRQEMQMTTLVLRRMRARHHRPAHAPTPEPARA